MPRNADDVSPLYKELMGIGLSIVERRYISVFLENHFQKSRKSESDLSVAVHSLLESMANPDSRQKFRMRMNEKLEIKSREEKYEECAVIRDMISNYDSAIQSEMIDNFQRKFHYFRT